MAVPFRSECGDIDLGRSLCFGSISILWREARSAPEYRSERGMAHRKRRPKEELCGMSRLCDMASIRVYLVADPVSIRVYLVADAEELLRSLQCVLRELIILK